MAVHGTVCHTLPRLKKTFNERHCEGRGTGLSLPQQSTLCCEDVCSSTTTIKHAIDVDSEWEKFRGPSVTVSFLLHGQRTAGGAEHSPTDLVESKRMVSGKPTKKRKKKWGSVSFIQHCNLCRWIASVAVRGSFCSMESIVLPTILTIKCGANRSDAAAALSAQWLLLYLTERQL